ncbi:MAG: 5-(carboxyamino)imidazole ribonucleotide synthase [Rhodospirillaceae bacterium]|nr:5-(carboxyamino)imidazole ribonucleotide synthase [Rhodospirillaceae bacterium]
MSPNNKIPPGRTIGIIGGGQLGRMSAVAAAEMGYKTHIFTPEKNSPASQVSELTIVAPYEDESALKKFAAGVDVITFEFENVPAASVKLLADLKPVRPGWQCLEIAQDRIREKTFAAELGIPTAPWAEVRSSEDLEKALGEIGAPAILKTTRMGYDGKGQVRINQGDNAQDAWKALGSDVGILEGFVDFVMEVSVITARGIDGVMESFDVVQNHHENGILDITIAPAPINDVLRARAIDTAEKMAEKMDMVGLLAVEMFITADDNILVNEMAPRPHNSGHWTQDGCKTSQFEQFIRAVTGLKLGTAERHSDAVMKNLIGADANDWETITQDGENKLHLYGKSEARPGRKMGHVNRLYPKGSGPKI